MWCRQVAKLSLDDGRRVPYSLIVGIMVRIISMIRIRCKEWKWEWNGVDEGLFFPLFWIGILFSFCSCFFLLSTYLGWAFGVYKNSPIIFFSSLGRFL